MASPTCQVPHLPKARCFLIQSNLAKAALARPPDSGCSSLTVACCPCHVLGLRTEATSLDLKEMDPAGMWHHGAPGGHRRPREKLKGGLLSARTGKGSSERGRPTAGRSGCVVWRPRPASGAQGLGPSSSLLAPRLMAGSQRPGRASQRTGDCTGDRQRSPAHSGTHQML